MSLPAVTHQALIYESVDDMVTRRVPYREEHLRLVRESQARDEIVMAGALGVPPNGALFIFKGASPATAEAFARVDPYVTQGLVVRWTVRPWSVVTGPPSEGG